MNIPEKIEILNQQLQEVEGLFNEGSMTSSTKFIRWREATKRRIRDIFGENSEHLKEFDSTSYLSMVFSRSDADQWQIDYKAYKSGLDYAKAQLLVMIDELSEMSEENNTFSKLEDEVSLTSQVFSDLSPFITKFKKDYPDSSKCAFIMMQFADTKLHNKIIDAIRSGCSAHKVIALRADDKSYSDDLLPNVRTYMHSCDFGIAIFERLTSDMFNPNVSLEVGYMMALDKPVLLLKDSTLTSLHTDLVGRLYQTFDTQNPSESIPPLIAKWLREKSLI